MTISAKILINFPQKAIVYFTTVHNCLMGLCHLPITWKLAEIIKSHKHAKPTRGQPVYCLPLVKHLNSSYLKLTYCSTVLT